MKLSFSLEGLPEVKELLEQVAPKEALNIIRATNYSVAKQLSLEVAEATPVDTGEMKSSVYIKRRNPRGKSYRARTEIHFKDPAWVFMEYGTVKMEGRHFVKHTVDRWKPGLEALMLKEFKGKFSKFLERKLKKSFIARRGF